MTIPQFVAGATGGLSATCTVVVIKSGQGMVMASLSFRGSALIVASRLKFRNREVGTTGRPDVAVQWFRSALKL